MRLKNVPESKNFEDRTRPAPLIPMRPVDEKTELLNRLRWELFKRALQKTHGWWYVSEGNR